MKADDLKGFNTPDSPRKWVGVNRHYWKVSSQRLFASNLVSFHPVVLKNIFKGFQFSTNEGKGPLELFAYCELKKNQSNNCEEFCGTKYL
jgi:hypothetical protein